MGEIHPKTAKLTPKGVIGGPNSPQNGPKYRNFKIFQTQDLIARSKNLAKADLMSPPPELFIFCPVKSPCFVRSCRVRPVKSQSALTKKNVHFPKCNFFCHTAQQGGKPFLFVRGYRAVLGHPGRPSKGPSVFEMHIPNLLKCA
jgi:hypothetical protein